MSYQAVGLYYAALWANTFDRDELVPSIYTMARAGLPWLERFIASSGEINTAGSTRVGQEPGPSGTTKVVDWKRTVLAFSYWATMMDNARWSATAWRIANFYCAAQ